MTRTPIEWLHRPGTIPESWNFIGGCTKCSPGCQNCYALAMSWRLAHNPSAPLRYQSGIVEKDHGNIQWTGRIHVDYEALKTPYTWRIPRTVFVCSMSDVFHEKVRDRFILKAFKVMADCPQHTFIVLTKRARRMRMFLVNNANVRGELCGPGWKRPLPLPNVWLMVSAENQEEYDKRIPDLLATRAVVHGVSIEPMLGGIDLTSHRRKYLSAEHWPHPLDWVIIGCESGPRRRPMDTLWALNAIRDCSAYKAPVFVKQLYKLGYTQTVSRDPSEWESELRKREFPNVTTC